MCAMSIEESTRPPRTRLRRLDVGSTTVVVVVALVAGYVTWWSRPTAFDGWGNAVGTTMAHDRLRTFNVNLSMGYTEPVVLRSAEPVVRRDTSRAEISFVLCTVRRDRLGFIAVRGSLAPDCSGIRPIAGRELRPKGDRVVLVMKVRPTRVGQVTIDGARVRYSRGWRHLRSTGWEQMGTGVRITVR